MNNIRHIKIINKLTNAILIFSACILILFYCHKFFAEYIITQIQDNTIIEFNDPAVEAIMKDVMSLPGDKAIRAGDTRDWEQSHLEEIILEGKDIKSLSDLRHFVGLTSLTIKNTRVTDFTPLESMQNIHGLKIIGGNMTDLRSISRMKQLVELELHDVSIHSIQPLAKLNFLYALTLNNLPVEDITVLDQMPTLMNLTLQDMSLEHFPEYQNLKDLQRIHLIGGDITEFSSLENMDSLLSMKIENTSIQCLPTLPESLKILYLEDINLTDLIGLPHTLKVLILENCSITDMESVYSLEHLSELTIDGVEYITPTENPGTKPIA